MIREIPNTALAPNAFKYLQTERSTFFNADTILIIESDFGPLHFNCWANLGGEPARVRDVAWMWIDDQQKLILKAGLNGEYYALTVTKAGDKRVLKVLHGKEAMLWLTENCIFSGHMRQMFRDAIENPEFKFMPLIPAVEKPKRKRSKARAAAQDAIAVQLEMATGIVEVIGTLWHKPSLETLAEACRRISALHQAIHAPENFKLAANS